MSYTTQEKYNIVKGFIKGAIIVPALGLAAHFGSAYLTNMTNYSELDSNIHADYSLKNRFECAYSFNTPDEHKHYHRTQGYWNENTGAFEKEAILDNYIATPWATYPAMILFGLGGAHSAIDKIRRKKGTYIPTKKQQTR